jgi:hypothetical protein
MSDRLESALLELDKLRTATKLGIRLAEAGGTAAVISKTCHHIIIGHNIPVCRCLEEIIPVDVIISSKTGIQGPELLTLPIEGIRCD